MESQAAEIATERQRLQQQAAELQVQRQTLDKREEQSRKDAEGGRRSSWMQEPDARCVLNAKQPALYMQECI